ncbi:MAG: hypothetical protein UZ21_OP11001000012 [Microgenomates bacterium OLB22]|nr:MAG: hypothetical protein UZ21_OP11001000012 [Microgenomates bacterium OLB22]
MPKKKHPIFDRKDFFWIAGIIIVALILRLYNFTEPVADWHSWRQADTAAVTRNFVRHGVDVLHPTYDDLSNVQSGMYNPKGYRFVEFPIYNAITAFTYTLFRYGPLQWYGRGVTIFFSLALIVSLYLIGKKSDGRSTAIAAAITAAVMPFSIYYSRVILPDMTAVSLATMSIVLMLLFTESPYRSKKAALYFAGGIITFALAILCKPTALFFGIPILYIFYLRYNIELIKRPATYIFGISVIAPFILWRIWISQYPEGIPYAQWLFTSVNTASGLQSILLRPSFFRWVFYERIALLICGGYAHCLALLGALKKTATYQLPLAFGISSLFYIFIFQGGNVQHDYYQIMLIPTIALLIGAGWSLLVSKNDVWKYQLINIFIGIVLVTASWYFSWNQVKNYYSLNRGVIKTAEVIKTLTLSTDLIATDTTGDTTLLYLSDRRGFPSLSDEPDKMFERGISYLVTYDMKNATKLSQKYETLFINDTVAILRLSK